MTKRQTELMRLAATVEAGDEGTAWRDRLEEWLVEKQTSITAFSEKDLDGILQRIFRVSKPMNWGEWMAPKPVPLESKYQGVEVP